MNSFPQPGRAAQEPLPDTLRQALSGLSADVPVPLAVTEAGHQALAGPAWRLNSAPSTGEPLGAVALTALTATGLRQVAADGPNAHLLTTAIVVAEKNAVVIPVGQDPVVTLDQVRAQLTRPCPDGHHWCTGDPRNHLDPREHIHTGPEYSITGPYGPGLLAFHLTQFGNDDEVRVAFRGDGDWPDLSLAEFDQLLTDTSRWRAEALAVRAQLIELVTESGGRPAPRTWVTRLHEKAGVGEHTETCPSWCTSDHNCEVDRKNGIFPIDIWHQTDSVALPLQLIEGFNERVEYNVLSAEVCVIPHASEPHDLPGRNAPHVQMQMVEGDDGYWTAPMGPEEFGAVIDQLAAHVDRLRGVHAQLVTARAEWDATDGRSAK